MLLQPKQISVSRNDEIYPTGRGGFQNTVVCFVTQHTHRAGRPHDFGDATNLSYVSDDISLGDVQLLPKRPCKFCKDGRRRNEGASPF